MERLANKSSQHTHVKMGVLTQDILWLTPFDLLVMSMYPLAPWSLPWTCRIAEHSVFCTTALFTKPALPLVSCALQVSCRTAHMCCLL